MVVLRRVHLSTINGTIGTTFHVRYSVENLGRRQVEACFLIASPHPLIAAVQVPVPTQPLLPPSLHQPQSQRLGPTRPLSLIHPPPPKHPPIPTPPLTPNPQPRLPFPPHNRVVPSMLHPDPTRHISHRQRPVENLALGFTVRQLFVHPPRPRVPDAVFADKRPVCV